ncbi:MAG: hypothetical protein JXR70_06715 [Spirochaetales bacterium]|nr:hypothetical protein [Spirochaetales bacterium]
MTILISKVETLSQDLTKRLNTILVALNENIFSLCDALLSLGIAEKEDLVKFEDKIPEPSDFNVNTTEKRDILTTRFLSMGRSGASRLSETKPIVDNLITFQHYVSYMIKVLKYIHPEILKVNPNFKEKVQIPFTIVSQGVQKLQSFFSPNSTESNIYLCSIELYKLHLRNSPALAPLVMKSHRMLKSYLDNMKTEANNDIERTDPLGSEELKAKFQSQYSKELSLILKEIIQLKEIDPASLGARLVKDFVLDLIYTEDQLADEVYHRLHMKTTQELKHEKYHHEIYEISQNIGRYQNKLSDIYSYTIEAIKTIKNNEGFILKVIRVLKELIGQPIQGVYGKQGGKINTIDFKPSLENLNEILKLMKKNNHDISAISPITEIEIILHGIFENVDQSLEEIYEKLFEVEYKGFVPDGELRRDIIYTEEKVFNAEKSKFYLLYENYLPFRTEMPTIGSLKTLV